MATNPKNRVTSVQVPGDTPPPDATNPSGNQATEQPSGTIETTGNAEGNGNAQDSTPAPAAPAETVDIEAIRAQAKAEARAEMQAELQSELQVAKAVLDKQVREEIINPANRAQYANMRAEEVDVSKLTSAVLTKDGWVCPATVAAPPAK